MRRLLGAAVAVALSACATATPAPTMRPLTQAHIDTMGATSVVVSENNHGIEKSWFYTSSAAAGAPYGLVGVLVSAAMDAMINAGPSRRAQKAANEIAEELSVETLNASLTAQLNRVAVAGSALPPVGVFYSDVRSEQRLLARDPIEDAVVVSVRYTLAEDASTLRIVGTASYQNLQTPYATPYSFRGSAPRTEREGPAYRNTFTYYSSQLPVPTLTLELRERLIANIQESYTTESGALPAEGTNEFRSMEHELDAARDDRLSKDEIAIFLTREWLRNDGELLRREIEGAHAFIARYVVLDMNRLNVPTMTGEDELLETAPDDRTVRRIGGGREAGGYISSAGNVTSFSTYGNVIGIARINNQRMEDIRAAARPQRNHR